MADATVPKSSELVTWQWDACRYRAAAQVADGTLKDAPIAKQAGITTRQLRKWKKQPEFSALVHGITADAGASIRDEVVASKAGRLRILVDMHNKLLAIIEARAERHANEREWAAGESTGLIVTKETWGKTNSQEAAVDLGLVKEIRSLHEQIVNELNDWDTSVSVKHSGRVDHVHRTAKYDNLSDDELDALERIAERAYAGGDA